MPAWWTDLAVPVTWPVVVLFALFVFGVPIWRMLRAFAQQMQDAEQLEIGLNGTRLALLRHELPYVSPSDLPQLVSDDSLVGTPVSVGTRTSYDELGKGQRGVHLVHTLAPSELPGQRYQVFLYLVGHQRSRFDFPDDLSDVVSGEFYLGQKWQEEVFSVPRRGRELLGLSTHAYGPFLCSCQVFFKDGRTAQLYRYVDFEAGKVLTTRRRVRPSKSRER